MSRVVNLSNEQITEYTKEFEQMLRGNRFSDGSIRFQKTIPVGHERARVYFTPEAWAKHTYLIDECQKEVAWHGVAERVDGAEGHLYVISDILVYPQTVTGASVDMDTEKYASWIQEHLEAEDERFEKLRMQAHSHVNMSVSPSSVDVKHQEDIVDMLGKDSFYIFMIYNKRRERYIKIFEMKDNIIFENSDVDVGILGFDQFVSEMKAYVVERTYTPPKYQGLSGQYTGGGKSEPTAPPKSLPEKKEEKAEDKPRTSFASGAAGGHAPYDAEHPYWSSGDYYEDDYMRGY